LTTALAGLQRCPLCQKYVDKNHTEAARHKEKENEHVLLDMWLGQTPSLRILTPAFEKGASLPATPQFSSRFATAFKGKLLEHWGCSPRNLINAARAKWQQCPGLAVKKNLYPWRKEAQMELAFINYSGSGKYSDTGNAVVPYRTLETGQHQFSEDLPTHDTWWPVVQVWIPGVWHNGEELQSLEHWVQVGTGGWICIVVCVYQWMWGQPVGWPARVINFSRM
jgi:hypothetical protein